MLRALAAIVTFVAIAAAQAPAVASFEPANGADGVAAGAIVLRIVFDREMDVTAGMTIMHHGEGLSFPKVDGQPKWVDARTLELAAVLEADTDYGCVFNGAGGAQRFRDRQGKLLPATEWRFATASAPPGDPAASAAMRAACEQSLARMQQAIAERYSYRDRLGVKWDERFAAQREHLLAATSRRQFVNRAAQVLGAARDPHLWFRLGDRVVPTHRTGAVPNWNPRVLPKLLPDLQQVNRNVLRARTDDGIVYVAVATFDRQQAADVQQVQDVLTALRDCSALVVDVRGNGGGDEQLARAIAAWFVDGEVVYAGHRFVDRAAEGGLGPVQPRLLRGNPDAAQRFAGRVAVLTGPVNMSSCEAFLLMMKSCPRATLVGGRSGGSSGNPQPIDLGDGVVLMVPSWQALRPDGTCFEGEGLAPDVEVAARPEDLATGDPVLARALALLRAK